MPLNLVLITARQTANGLALSWGPMEDVSAYQVFVASRKLAPEELEAAAALGGTDDCVVAKVLSSVSGAAAAPPPPRAAPAAARPAAAPARAAPPADEDPLEARKRAQAEQDGGARREAKRMVGDALLVFPNHPGAKALLAEMG